MKLNSKNRKMSYIKKMETQKQRGNLHLLLEMVLYQTPKTEKGEVGTIRTETKRFFTHKKSKQRTCPMITSLIKHKQYKKHQVI
jgi:hypothetical protein